MRERRFVTFIAILLVLCLPFATCAAGSGVYPESGDTGAAGTAGGVRADSDPGILREGPVSNDAKRSIKVLCVGNSLSQDCMAYMPFIAQGLTDQVEITLGIAFHRGAGINDYIDFYDQDTISVTYNKKSPDKDEWTITWDQTFRQVLADEDWDIVTFQQKSGQQEKWPSYSDSNELIQDVVGFIAATHKKDVCVGWLMPQVRYKTATDRSFDDLARCVQEVLETTPASFAIPCGAAVHYAEQSGLKQIGEGGGLTHDGVHLQEGLPCLLTAYVSAMKILDICGVQYRPVFDDQTRPVEDWVDAHNIPGQNGKSVGVTEENCRLAQELACKAIQYPYGEQSGQQSGPVGTDPMEVGQGTVPSMNKKQ